MAKNRKKKQKQRKKSFAYNVVITIGIIATLIPLAAYATVITVFDVPSPGFIILGLIGSIAIMFPILGLSMAMANFAERKKMHPKDIKGLKFSGITFLGCLLFIGMCSAFSLIPGIYSRINEPVLSFYAFGIFTFIFIIIFYSLSRIAIDIGFRYKGLSNSTIKKMKKGIKNHWWYEALNKEYGMGALYHCNKYFTISFVVGSAVHITLGWLFPFIWVSVAMFWVMGLTLSVLTVYASFIAYKKVSTKQHEIEYGKMRTRARKSSAIEGIVCLPFLVLFLCSALTWFALSI